MADLFDEELLTDFEKDFGVLDWDTSGAKYVTDGSGSNQFRGDFLDQCNGSVINSQKWFVVETATVHAHAISNRNYRLYVASGGSVGDTAYIKTKRILGSISHNGVMTVSINILGSAKGGQGILTGNNTDQVMFFGLYRDTQNYVGIVSRNNAADTGSEYYHLVTCNRGVETVSAEFNIMNEAVPDILIQLIIEQDYVQVLKDGVLVALNTTNVPNNSDLRAYASVRKGNLGLDSKIDIDYFKVQI